MKAIVGFAFFMLFLAGIAFVTLQGRQQMTGQDAQGPGLYGTRWVPVSLAGNQIPEDVEIFVTFGDDGSIDGHAGCNRYFGSMEQSDDGITVGPLGSTRMACPEPIMQRETDFLDALQNMKSFETAADQLKILDEQGKVLAQFKRG